MKKTMPLSFSPPPHRRHNEEIVPLGDIPAQELEVLLVSEETGSWGLRYDEIRASCVVGIPPGFSIAGAGACEGTVRGDGELQLWRIDKCDGVQDRVADACFLSD